MSEMMDVVIVGGGPGGLSAALALGRACKRVLLCDAGPRRNQAATQMFNFVSRDGVEPEAFRRASREQIARYPNVQLRDVGVRSIGGSKGDFAVTLDDEAGSVVRARRIILCVGMIDEVPAIEGAAERWGRSIFQCPYCHGWEHRDRPWAYLALSLDKLDFSSFLRGWSPSVVALTQGAFEVTDERIAALAARGVTVDPRPIVRLEGEGGALARIVVEGGAHEVEALFVHPPQRHVPLVTALGLELEDGFVRVDPMRRETSIAGIYAAGDLQPMVQGGQGAIFAASAALRAAAMLNHELTLGGH